MKVFVADEGQPGKTGRCRSRGVCRQQGRIFVFKSAAALTKYLEEKIPFKRQETPETASFADDFLQILRRALTIPLTDCAYVNHVMLAAIDVELADREVSCDNRRINQGIKIVTSIMIWQAIRSRIQSRHRLLPLGWQ